jgi:hypothetical protein
MNDEKFRITIPTFPHKERPVAEIYYNNMYWVQISQETDDLVIQFYAHITKKCWEFQFDEALEVIEKLKKTYMTEKIYTTN